MGLFQMSWIDIMRAAVLAIVVAVITYVYGHGDVFTLDWHAMVNNGVMAGIGSILVSLGTTRRGNFAGAVPVQE